MALNEQEIQFDTYQLEDGRRVCRMTHIPTGIYVEDDGERDRSVYERMDALTVALEAAMR
ncbi:MAG: hypothetical protein ACREHD_00675 [Pirellulales bacterium]